MEQEMEQEKVSWKNELVEWAESIMISLTVMIFLFTFVIGIVVVNGESMIPTLQHQDRLLTLPIFYNLSADDIVVIHREEEDSIIKRVIATEGQTVDIDFSTGTVYVDGKALSEPYIAEPATKYDPQRFIDFPAVVPEGCVFVMGDNRNDSLDSRYQEIGMIHEEQIFGKVFARIFPFDQIGAVS
jgi:signal peptidase I